MSDLLEKKIEVIRTDIHEHRQTVDGYVKQTLGWQEQELSIA